MLDRRKRGILAASHEAGAMTRRHRHLNDEELLAYRVGSADAALDAPVAAEIAACEDCARRLAETDRFLAGLADPLTWRESLGEGKGFQEGLSALRAETAARAEMERAAADSFGELEASPCYEWPERVRRLRPNELLTRRLIDAAVAALDLSPEEALMILEAGEVSTRKMSPRIAAEYRSEVWKNRANAFRMTGSYEKALAATSRAARYAGLWPTGAYALGQVIYTRGTILFKMGRYAEANDCADAAVEYLRDFGDRRRIAYAKNLKAAICTEDGRLREAVVIYSELRPEMEELQDAFGVATMTANLATTNVRLGNLSVARKFAIEALQRFIDLGSTANEVRMKWVLGTIRESEGDRDGAVSQLRSVATEFENLGMHGDAARVKLEIAEELLRGEDWEEVERVARDAAETFAKNDARLHLAEALGYLRRAVEERSASPELAAYIRSYIETDDQAAAFSPPVPTRPAN
jgi:tetratricopeptide (TPR) repeat protein